MVQQRNPHSYEADFAAELPLYLQGRALVSHISTSYLNNSTFTLGNNLPKAIEDIWVDLYERGYIEIEDVYLAQQWLKTLLQIGYKFPRSSETAVDTSSASDIFLKLANSGHSIRELSETYMQTTYYNATFKTTKCLMNPENSEPSIVMGNSDLHSGPRTDLTSLLTYLGQKIVLMGVKGKDNNYPKVYESTSVQLYDKSSPIVKKYRDHSDKLTPEAILQNAEFYAQDSVMKLIDAFTCTFPAAMCQMWLALNKTIVYLPAHRYNLGRCTTKEWKKLDHDLYQMAQDPSKRHTIGAMSRYDAEYLQFYTGIKPELLTSFSGYYTDNNLYNPVKEEFLIFCLKEGGKEFIQNVKQVLQPEFKAERAYDLYKFYTVKDLTSHPAVIMLPYSVMSYRLTELYALSIPLFMPSPKFFLKSNGIGHDRTSTSKPYCSIQDNLESEMRSALKLNFSPHPYSPNLEYDEDVEAEIYWLQMSDFYDWPHIQLFDSYEHLKVMLAQANFQDIHMKMREEVELRGLELNRKWCDVIGRIKAAKGMQEN